MKRPKISEENNDLLDQVNYLIEMDKYCDYLEEQNKQLSIHGVINWVAVDKQNPPTIDLLYLTYNGDEMVFRYWNSTYFEGEHIASEPKVTHWAIVKPPCL